MKTHTIKFREPVTLQIAPPQESGRVRTKATKFQKGQCVSAVTIRAYVENGIEKCDIALANGCEMLAVEYATFQFLDTDFSDTSPGVDA